VKVAVAGVAVLFLAACGASNTPEPTVTPSATTRPAPTVELTATQGPEPTATPDARCSEPDFNAGLDTLKPFNAQFVEAFALALKTAGPLDRPISDMQTARSGIESADVPDCMENYRLLLEASATAGIDAFLSFEAEDGTFDAKVDAALAATTLATNELRRIRPGG
jgi:hypothetical protein